MRITCLGAARTVTGSAYLVERDPDTLFLVDCGMYQGGRQIEERNWDVSDYRAKDLRAIFITHAHIDHSGLVPRLVRAGYSGPVYATKATSELLKILWADSAHIQEMEARWQTRKNSRQGGAPVEPLYETADAEAASRLVLPIETDDELELLPGVKTRFVLAGHILGAASLFVDLQCGGEGCRLGFSGDVGRPNQLIVPDSDQLPRPDMLFMETTYGGRRHKSLPASQAELIDIVKQAYAEGGKVIIPAFAVERTQEIIYTLAAAYRNGDMPHDMPVYLDSPLAIKATKIFRKNPEFFDEETRSILEAGGTPLNLPTLQFTPSTEESQAINEQSGPAVIIAANGMCSAGRIKHHLKHNLWRHNAHVVIVGYQAQGTTGRKLVDGAETVTIFREEVAVRAHVHTIGGFSAHADQDELMQWLRPLTHDGLKVNLMHGEEEASLQFMEIAQKEFPGVQFQVPEWKQVIELGVTPVAERPAAPAPRPPAPPKPEERAQSARQRLEQLTQRMGKLGAEGLTSNQLAMLELAIRQAEMVMEQAEAA